MPPCRRLQLGLCEGVSYSAEQAALPMTHRAPPAEVIDAMEAFPADAFTMIESSGSTFLMRGKICFAEIREQDGAWRVWGYGLDSYVGPYPSFTEAGRAAVKDAWTTLKGAKLSLVDGEEVRGEK